jgi:hypothetical protein
MACYRDSFTFYFSFTTYIIKLSINLFYKVFFFVFQGHLLRHQSGLSLNLNDLCPQLVRIVKGLLYFFVLASSSVVALEGLVAVLFAPYCVQGGCR